VDVNTAAKLQAMAARLHDGQSAEIPVGVGFCLYVRHDCLAQVGLPDAAVFGRGYGEESDFCMRARARGWSHRLAADVFVFHAGGRSFAGRRAALLERSQALLEQRYPGYAAAVWRYIRSDPLHRLDCCVITDGGGSTSSLKATMRCPGTARGVRCSR
jgi:GT2 family glycosyltransferase